ncbi:MAG TPA: glycosyltransferase family 39 protein, partial [Candidatus Baltobacteraceae bacterium]|nr:glycosyltransferase family 39 protein [Candidatus Baltobacteraceae bacterium]
MRASALRRTAVADSSKRGARTASYVLAAIVALAAALRLFDLSSVPSELNYDEIDLYNSAYSIVHTGHDVDGRLMPFLYSPYSRNPPLYGIASYASAQILGRTAFALRLPAVLFGLAAIVLLYAIVLELTRRREIALIAAMLAAIQPIFVHFSRVGWEPAAELPFVLGGLYLLLRWRGDLETALWAALVLGIASYTYMAAWFYSALLGGVLLVLRAASLRGKSAWLAVPAAAAAWLVVSWPALLMLFTDPLTRGRAQRIFTFAAGVTPQTLTAFAHNYAVHFSAQYLVLTGMPQSGTTWRYLNGFGAFFW